MGYVIWGGAGLSMLGLIGILYCVVLATRAKREGGTDDEIRAKLQRVVVLNLVALLMSMMGLALVIVGIILQ